MKSFILSTLLLFSSAASYAHNHYYYCPTNTGKNIAVDMNGENWVYKFGRNLRNPEIILRNGVENSHETRSGFQDSWTFYKGQSYVYVVYANFKREDDDVYVTSGGVWIKQGNKVVADIKCKRVPYVGNG